MSYDNWLESPYDGVEKTITVDVSCRHEFEDFEGEWRECPFTEAITTEVWVHPARFISFEWACPTCGRVQEEELDSEDVDF